MSDSGHISLNGKACYVGEALAGVGVAIEGNEKSGLTLVRYANVKLGYLEASPNARLRPPAYAVCWEKRVAKKEKN